MVSGMVEVRVKFLPAEWDQVTHTARLDHRQPADQVAWLAVQALAERLGPAYPSELGTTQRSLVAAGALESA